MALSEDDPLVSRVMEWIERGNRDLDEEKAKAQQIIGAYDDLREILYEEWDPNEIRVRLEDDSYAVVPFSKTDRETWPLCLRDQRLTLEAFDKLHEGVGYSHQFVIKYRYQNMNPRVQPLQPVQSQSRFEQAAPSVVVQGASAPVVREDASRVRSVLTGPFEVRIERLRLEAEKENRRLETQRRSPLETGEVSQDPLEPGNELIAYLNALREYLVRCFEGWGRRRNRYYAESAHRKLRRLGVKLIATVESFVYATSGLNVSEMNDKLTAQTSLFTEILRAQAGVPVTIQEYHGVTGEEGVDLTRGFDGKRKKPLLSDPRSPRAEAM